MSLVVGPIMSYDNARVINALVGATALRQGDLCKFSSGALIPCADNDENLVVYVSLADAALNATSQFVPLADAKIKLAYTGSAPTLGEAYGISDCRTLDQANTTQLLLIVVKVGAEATLDAGMVEAIQYSISA